MASISRRFAVQISRNRVSGVTVFDRQSINSLKILSVYLRPVKCSYSAWDRDRIRRFRALPPHWIRNRIRGNRANLPILVADGCRWAIFHNRTCCGRRIAVCRCRRRILDWRRRSTERWPNYRDGRAGRSEPTCWRLSSIAIASSRRRWADLLKLKNKKRLGHLSVHSFFTASFSISLFSGPVKISPRKNKKMAVFLWLARLLNMHDCVFSSFFVKKLFFRRRVREDSQSKFSTFFYLFFFFFCC